MIDLSLLTQEFIDKSFAQIVLNGNKEEVAFFAEFVCNPNMPEPRFGRLPVWMALEHEDTYDKTKIILSLNPDVNVQNEEGQTPLMVALSKRMSAVGILFLRHPTTDVNIVDKKGDGVMKYAVMSRSSKAVFEAAKAGVAISPIDSQGNIPAYYAVQNNDFEVFEALFQSGLKRDMNDAAYQKVVQLALQKSLEEKSLRWARAVCRGVFPKEKTYKKTKTWKQLYGKINKLPKGLQVEVRQMLGIPNVALNGINKVVKQNVQDVLGQALIEQARYGSVNDVGVLLRLGANPNTRGRMGRTALLCAVESMGNPEEKKSAYEISDSAYRKAKLLLEAGADPDLSTLAPHNREKISNSTPIMSSLLLDRIGITRLLIKAGASLKTTSTESLFKIAVQYAKPEAIPVLIAAGLDLWQAEQKEKLLEDAVRSNKPHTVAMMRNCLVGQGVDFDKYYGSLMGCRQISPTNSDMIAALRGCLAGPSRTTQSSELSGKSLSEKISSLTLSQQEKLRVIVADSFLQAGLKNDTPEKEIIRKKQTLWSQTIQNLRQFFRG